MLGHLVAGLVIGFLAVLGGRGLGLEWDVAWSLGAVPVVFSFFGALRGLAFSIFLAFGLGALLWTYTPLSEAVELLIDRAFAATAERQ